MVVRVWVPLVCFRPRHRRRAGTEDPAGATFKDNDFFKGELNHFFHYLEDTRWAKGPKNGGALPEMEGSLKAAMQYRKQRRRP